TEAGPGRMSAAGAWNKLSRPTTAWTEEATDDDIRRADVVAWPVVPSARRYRSIRVPKAVSTVAAEPEKLTNNPSRETLVTRRPSDVSCARIAAIVLWDGPKR